MHCHDVLELHHDKDFRCLSVFPVKALNDCRLQIWRINYWGQLEIDSVTQGTPKRTVAVMIHRGHMRALQGSGGSLEELARTWTLANRQVKEYATWGWETCLEEEDEGVPLMDSKGFPCKRCKAPTLERVGSPPEAVPEEQICLPLRQRPSLRVGSYSA